MYSRTLEPATAGGAAERPSSFEAVRQVLVNHCAQFDGQHVVRLPGAASLELVRTLASSVRKSLKQIVPLSGPVQPGDSFVQLVFRELAKQHTVQRIYLWGPDGTDRDALDGLVSMDRRYALDAKVMHAAAPAAQALPLRNTWLIDDQLLVHEDFTDDGTAVWTVDSRTEMVHRNITVWEKLWGTATAPGGVPADTSEKSGTRTGARAPRSGDPLLASADLIATMAPMSCTGTPDDPQSCAWYHGAWQHLRLLDLVPVPAWHDDFYASEIGNGLRERHGSAVPRVLISGAADYALLGETLRAAGRVALETERGPRIAVLDRCPTPLIACRWYARQTNSDVDLYEMNVCDAPERLGDGSRFDLILSDSFLTNFSTPAAAEVLRAWRRLLTPGGRVITTVRLRSAETADGWGLDEVLAFANRARARAERWRWLLRTDAEDIARAAEQFARRVRSTNLGSAEAVRRMFVDAGFQVERATKHVIAAQPNPVTYLRVVATSAE